jgi:hypothetical protein
MKIDENPFNRSAGFLTYYWDTILEPISKIVDRGSEQARHNNGG